jgi:hypothetical protein
MPRASAALVHGCKQHAAGGCGEHAHIQKSPLCPACHCHPRRAACTQRRTRLRQRQAREGESGARRPRSGTRGMLRHLAEHGPLARVGLRGGHLLFRHLLAGAAAARPAPRPTDTPLLEAAFRSPFAAASHLGRCAKRCVGTGLPAAVAGISPGIIYKIRLYLCNLLSV